MKLFIDTANVQHIKEINEWGVLSGVTTNPSLASKENRNYRECLAEIAQIISGPVSGEAVSLDAGGMIDEGRALAAIAANVNVKVPMCPEGLKAIRVLASEGIKTNCTLVFSANQALLAASAGATFVSPFIGRLDDIGNSGMTVLREIVDLFEIHKLSTKVISASIRHPQHVIDSALAGAHIATIPYAVFNLMAGHPLTEIGIERFLADWEKIKNL